MLEKETIQELIKRKLPFLANGIADVTANEVMKLILSQLDIDIGYLKKIIVLSGLNITSEQVDFWLANSESSSYKTMTNAELFALVDIIISHSKNFSKSSENIIIMRHRLDLTQTELAKALGMAANHRQVARWEAGQSEMPDKKWQKLIQLTENKR